MPKASSVTDYRALRRYLPEAVLVAAVLVAAASLVACSRGPRSTTGAVSTSAENSSPSNAVSGVRIDDGGFPLEVKAVTPIVVGPRALGGSDARPGYTHLRVRISLTNLLADRQAAISKKLYFYAKVATRFVGGSAPETSRACQLLVREPPPGFCYVALDYSSGNINDSFQSIQASGSIFGDFGTLTLLPSDAITARDITLTMVQSGSPAGLIGGVYEVPLPSP